MSQSLIVQWWMKSLAVLTWQRVIVVILLLHVASRHGPAGLSPFFKIGLVALLVLRIALELSLSIQRLRQAKAASFVERATLFVPPWILAQGRWHSDLLTACVSYLLRRPLALPELPGQTFSVLQKSQYATLFAMIIISILLDFPINLLIIGSLVQDPSKRQFIHCVLLLLTGYTFLLILGDRYLLPLSTCVLDERHLHLRITQRFAADIALEDIYAVSRFDEVPGEWARKKKYRQYHDYVVVSPTTIFDRPNLLIEIRPQTCGTMECKRQSLPLARYVLLYVDQPNDLLLRLQKKD